VPGARLKLDYAWSEFHNFSSWLLSALVRWSAAALEALANGAKAAAEASTTEWNKLSR